MTLHERAFSARRRFRGASRSAAMYGVLVSALVAGTAAADECRCKDVKSSEYETRACPRVARRGVPKAEAIALQFRSIELEKVMKLVGDFAAVEVCISSEITGRVTVDVAPANPWPEAVAKIALRNHLESRVNERQILLRLRVD